MRAKKSLWLIVVICTFIFITSDLVYASSTQDWVYPAIVELGRGRDIPGFELITKPNRNQSALLIARLLQHLGGEDHLQSRRFGVSQNVYLDSMIFSYNQRVVPEFAFSAIQVQLLYELVLEFSEELEILGYAIQDFKMLYAQNVIEQQEGLFTERKLLYSEQALLAARKRTEQYELESNLAETDLPSEALIEEIIPELAAPRNLWTGQFSAAKFLPPASSFSVLEPQIEPVPPLQIGGVEVSASLRSPNLPREGKDSDGSESESGAGYGISMRVGDVALNTAIDLGVDQQLIPKKASTSVDLSWDWADLFTISAGYRQGVNLQEGVKLDEETTPIVTSLGLVVPINRGQVSLGMIQEWNFRELEGNTLRDDELARSTSAAELGLSYDFKNDSSLRFNYRFIDFTNLTGSESEAEAAFSIKF